MERFDNTPAATRDTTRHRRFDQLQDRERRNRERAEQRRRDIVIRMPQAHSPSGWLYDCLFIAAAGREMDTLRSASSLSRFWIIAVMSETGWLARFGRVGLLLLFHFPSIEFSRAEIYVYSLARPSIHLSRPSFLPLLTISRPWNCNIGYHRYRVHVQKGK